MRLLTLVFITAVYYCNVQAVDVEELIKEAEEMGARFSESALERMEGGGKWGSKRSERSTDVVIFIDTMWRLYLTKLECSLGKYTDDLLPEEYLDAGTSTVFGIQSTQPMTGVQCSLQYKAASSTDIWFSVQINSPYNNGESIVTVNSSDLMTVRATSEPGNNNQVRVFVNVLHPQAQLESSQHGGSSADYKKANRAHNTFIKASKSGSRVRTI